MECEEIHSSWLIFLTSHETIVLIWATFKEKSRLSGTPIDFPSVSLMLRSLRTFLAHEITLCVTFTSC